MDIERIKINAFTTVTRVRLNLLSTAAPARIREFQLFLQPETAN